MTEPNPADVLAKATKAMEHCFDAYEYSSWALVHGDALLEALAAALRQQAQPTPDAMREQGQAEGFAAAVQQLRDMSAQKPNPALAVPAAHLADILEQSRIPSAALEQS